MKTTATIPCPAGRLRVGTSGYAYPEWGDAGFYPPGTAAREMLPVYARHFSITELNYTWYQMPKAPAMARMLPKVPADFDFALKLTRTMTHEIDPNGWRGQVARFREGIAPLVQAGRMAALLIQLPPGFDRSPDHRRYLALLLDELAGLPVAVEFRHRSWAEDRVFAELERRRVTLVTVDAPDLPYLFPTLEVVTNPDLIYLRFHGRNARGWRSGDMQKQFDYLYSPDQLRQWSQETIPRMTAQAHEGIAFFNNHVRAQAPKNAQLLMRQLSLPR
ncbi:MAG: DUF72 domain-containing protein [Desulfatitalea sp.]|nr:DUF72 domain-containing protein [Desulfatitalea sp.]NNK00458.1 DUF72 domain-containing protein [Desulfatitalea sp.]